MRGENAADILTEPPGRDELFTKSSPSRTLPLKNFSFAGASPNVCCNANECQFARRIAVGRASERKVFERGGAGGKTFFRKLFPTGRLRQNEGRIPTPLPAPGLPRIHGGEDAFVVGGGEALAGFDDEEFLFGPLV